MENYFCSDPHTSILTMLSMWVCLCICRRVCMLTSLMNCTSQLRQIFVHIARDRGSVPLWWLYNTLYTSVFVDDYVPTVGPMAA